MDSALTAQRPIGRARSPKTYGTGRVCENVECDTRLSRYNKRDFCHVHAPVKYPRIRGTFENKPA